MPALFLSACFENLVQNTVEKAFDDIHEEVTNPVRIQKEWEEISDVEEQVQIAKEYSTKLATNSKKAVYFNTMVAERGGKNAQLFLGNLYYRNYMFTGNNFTQNLPLAEKWYTKAADQGSAEAMLSLGELYSKGGKGLLSNQQKSREWYDKGLAQYLASAQQGDTEAKFSLAELYKSGKAGERDLEQSAQWYESAAFDGHVPSVLKTCQNYFVGKGVDKSRIKCYAWCEVARFLGSNATNMAKASLNQRQTQEAENLAQHLIKKIQVKK